MTSTIMIVSYTYFRLPLCRDYFRDLFYKVDVIFVDKNVAGDPGFTLTLSMRMNYWQIAKAAAEKLEVKKTTRKPAVTSRT